MPLVCVPGRAGWGGAGAGWKWLRRLAVVSMAGGVQANEAHLSDREMTRCQYKVLL